jgi:hypothetical protein
MIGVCESLLYARRAGLDLETMLQAIRGGAAACWALDNLAPRVLKGNFEPGFFVDHFVKDMGLALDEAERMKLQLPGLTLVRAIYVRAQQLGYGRKGTQALYLALEQMAKKGEKKGSEVPGFWGSEGSGSDGPGFRSSAIRTGNLERRNPPPGTPAPQNPRTCSPQRSTR